MRTRSHRKPSTKLQSLACSKFHTSHCPQACQSLHVLMMGYYSRNVLQNAQNRRITFARATHLQPFGAAQDGTPPRAIYWSRYADSAEPMVVSLNLKVQEFEKKCPDLRLTKVVKKSWHLNATNSSIRAIALRAGNGVSEKQVHTCCLCLLRVHCHRIHRTLHVSMAPSSTPSQSLLPPCPHFHRHYPLHPITGEGKYQDSERPHDA